MSVVHEQTVYVLAHYDHAAGAATICGVFAELQDANAECLQLARRAGVPVVPSSGRVVPQSTQEALSIAAGIGYPVMVKATAGGGGMGMSVCMSAHELAEQFTNVKERAHVSGLSYCVQAGC